MAVDTMKLFKFLRRGLMTGKGTTVTSALLKIALRVAVRLHTDIIVYKAIQFPIVDAPECSVERPFAAVPYQACFLVVGPTSASEQVTTELVPIDTPLYENKLYLRFRCVADCRVLAPRI